MINWLPRLVIAVLIGHVTASPAQAQLLDSSNVVRASGRLNGTVVDYTLKHGSDRRIFSPILGMRRDLYVYLPPGYDPHRAYPLIIFFHMANSDERFFARSSLLKAFDGLISAGAFPARSRRIP